MFVGLLGSWAQLLHRGPSSKAHLKSTCQRGGGCSKQLKMQTLNSISHSSFDPQSWHFAHIFHQSQRTNLSQETRTWGPAITEDVMQCDWLHGVLTLKLVIAFCTQSVGHKRQQSANWDSKTNLKSTFKKTVWAANSASMFTQTWSVCVSMLECYL